MDERQLQCFLAIADMGSVTRAADKLDVAQPSLSQILLRLEEELRVKLFDRTSRGVLLTESGRVFQEHARNIVREMDRAREEIRRDDVFVASKVSIGLPSSLSTLIGSRLVIASRREFPGLSLNVCEAMSGHIRRWLEEGVLDLGVLYNGHDLRTLSATQVASEELFLVGPRDAFGALGPDGIALKTADWSVDRPPSLILPSRQHGLRQFVEDKTKSKNVKIDVAIEIDSLPNIKALVIAGEGYSLLAHAAIMSELAAGDLAAMRVTKPHFRRSIYIVRNSANVVTRASIKIADLLVSLLDRMLADGWIASKPSRD